MSRQTPAAPNGPPAGRPTGAAGSTDQGAEAETRGRPSPDNTGDVGLPEVLAGELAVMAQQLQQQTGPEDVMARVVAAAVTLVPGVDEGSVSLVQERRSISSRGASSDLPRLLDRLQQETRQGPCMDAAFEHLTVRSDDLSSDERWPRLARRVAGTDIRSVLCLQLFVEGNDLGALNLVARRPHAFDDESEQTGLLLASHAAVAVADALELHGTRRALANRDLIGQAKGVLMERHRLTAQQAFDLLVRVSQRQNRTIVDLADDLTRSGELAPG